MIVTATVIATVGCGLMAGVFYIFSTVIVRSVGRLDPEPGATAMQHLNSDIVRPQILFTLLFTVTGLVCLALAVAAPFTWDEPGSAWRLAGGLLYFLGAFVVTVAANIPLNNRLDAADASSPDGQAFWREYQRRWIAWNHVRAATSTAALVAMTLALVT